MPLEEMPKILNLNQVFEVLNVDMIRYKELPDSVSNILKYEFEGWITTRQMAADIEDTLKSGNIFDEVAKHLESQLDEVIVARNIAEAAVERFRELENLASKRACACRDFFEEYGLGRILYIASNYENYLRLSLLHDYFIGVRSGKLFTDPDYLIEVANAMKATKINDALAVEVELEDINAESNEFNYFRLLSRRQFFLTMHAIRDAADRHGVEPDDGIPNTEPGSTTEAVVRNDVE